MHRGGQADSAMPDHKNMHPHTHHHNTLRLTISTALQIISCSNLAGDSCEIFAEGAASVTNLTRLTDSSYSISVQVRILLLMQILCNTHCVTQTHTHTPGPQLCSETCPKPFFAPHSDSIFGLLFLCFTALHSSWAPSVDLQLTALHVNIAAAQTPETACQASLQDDAYSLVSWHATGVH